MIKKDTTRGKDEAGALRKRLASFVSTVKKADRTTKALCVSVVLAVVVMAVVIAMILTNPRTSNDVNEVHEDETVLRNPLTGERTDTIGIDQLPRAFAVMVENSADAWPLAGLQDAFLVIEAPVEGSIPRFEVFFDLAAETEKIGPVRSARAYYLDWADELDAVYVHVGGSPEALDLIQEYGTIDLNEFFQGEYFYRWSKRYAPHNAYTTMDNLREALDNELSATDIDGPQYEFWAFKDGAASGEAKSISIDWTSGMTYDVDWNYDATTNVYTRDQGGTSNLLESGVDAVANNVVVMETDIGLVAGDDKGRRTLRTTGEGDVMVFQDGRVIVGTWKKETRTDRLRFFDSSGNEVAMNAGKTWIEVVSSHGQVTITGAVSDEAVWD